MIKGNAPVSKATPPTPPSGGKWGAQHVPPQAGGKGGGSSLSHPTPTDPKAAISPRTTSTTFRLKFRVSTQQGRLNAGGGKKGGPHAGKSSASTAIPSLPALKVVSELLLRHSEILKGLLVPRLKGSLPASARQQLIGSIPGSFP